MAGYQKRKSHHAGTSLKEGALSFPFGQVAVPYDSVRQHADVSEANVVSEPQRVVVAIRLHHVIRRGRPATTTLVWCIETARLN